MTNAEFCTLIKNELEKAKTQKEVDSIAQSMISFININMGLVKRKLHHIKGDVRVDKN